MLTDKKIILNAKTIIDNEDKKGVEIINYGAVINMVDGDISFYNRQLDKEACKEHRAIIRTDQAEFEDYAYDLQDKLRSQQES